VSNSSYLPPIIAIGGEFESGKDAVGSVLVRTYGYTRVAFGDFVKDACVQLLSGSLYPPEFPGDIQEIILAHRNDPHAVNRKPTAPAMRRLLQFVGTDWYRVRNPNHWVGEFDNYVRPILASGGRVAAPDMRFDNEGAYAATHGGEEWVVVRPDLEPSPYREHVSERSYTRTPHCVINNDGSLGLLVCRVVDALQDAQARYLGQLAA